MLDEDIARSGGASGPSQPTVGGAFSAQSVPGGGYCTGEEIQEFPAATIQSEVDD